MVKCKKIKRDNHVGNGDPAITIVLNQKVRCKTCPEEFDEGDKAHFCHVDNSFYCNICKRNEKRPHFGLNGLGSGEKKHSTKVFVQYNEQPEREKVLEEVKEDFKEKFGDSQDDLPDEEVLENAVDKRMNQNKKEVEQFEEEAIPVSQI